MASYRFFFCCGGNSGRAGQASLDHADRMQEREPVGVFIGSQGGFVHQATDSKVGQEQAPELLLHQLWRLTAQHDLGAAQVCLEFIQGGFYLPALVAERSQFLGGSTGGVEDVVINR